jgi:hypothetical protein
MSASAATTFSSFMRAVIIRCASLSDRSARAPSRIANANTDCRLASQIV